MVKKFQPEAVMKFMIFEGTPQEFTDVAPMMGLKPTDKPANNGKTEEIATQLSTPADDLTVEQVKAVLERRPLAEPVKAMLKLLYEAGEKRISSDTLKEALGYNAHEFRGMLGAFGRRRANTEGIPEGVKLLDEHWDHELRQKTWSLPANARKALEDLGLV